MTYIWPVPGIEFSAIDEREETRPVILVTTPRAFSAVGSDLQGLNIVHKIEAQSATAPYWMQLAAGLLSKKSEWENAVVYAVGGGMVVDTAKYLAHHSQLPLVSIPTALSVDNFFTWAAAVRHGGCVEYLETRPPDRVVIDFDLIAAAPQHLRAAGITDILSIATSLWDWEYAEEMGENPEGMDLLPWAADAAQAVLQGALECAEAAGAGDPGGLKQLLDCLVMEVQLCNLLGHSRPAEGSEHYFAYSVENHLETPLPHSALLAPGILLAAKRQEQDLDELQYALDACHVDTKSIPQPAIQKTLKTFPKYVQDHDLPFGIAHEWHDVL